MKTLRNFTLLAFASLFMLSAAPYPIDGYENTCIRRLRRMQMILDGDIKAKAIKFGATKSIRDIKLNLLDERSDSLKTLPEPDADLQKQINDLFYGLSNQYSITVMDITPGRKIRYASRRENAQYQPGSVGKIAIAIGFFTELAKIYPKSFIRRIELLRQKQVRAGRWAMSDHHTVPFFDPDSRKYYKRTVIESDVFTLFEWLDHMVSVSNNGAASVCWREALLMRAFGKDYPELTEEEATKFFKDTPKTDLTDMALSVVNDPLRLLCIEEDEWRLGSFFTRGAGAIVPRRGGSTGTPVGLMKFLVALERGAVIDSSSSLEIKRLLYMTDRRIRYAAASRLDSAAVYFKSGSLYSCNPNLGGCGKYAGNVYNYMNSVIIVEHNDGTTYIVALMSNVLRKNSASDHYALATRIDRILKKPRPDEVTKEASQEDIEGEPD